MECWAGEYSRGARLGHRDQEGALCTVPAVVTAWPGGALRTTSAVVPGPAFRAVPWAQACLKVGGCVVATGEWVLIRQVPAVVFPVAQLLGLHADLVLAVVVSQGAAGLGGWVGQG